MRTSVHLLGGAALILGACSSPAGSAPSPLAPDGGAPGDGSAASAEGSAGADGASPRADGGAAGADASVDAAQDAVADAGTACSTRITYGGTWIHAANHPESFDVVSAKVTWDGSCTTDGPSSYAVLSNGFKPYFQGTSACILALDYDGSCGVPAACTTRVSYGPAWLPAPNHPASYDDVPGRVFSDGLCHPSGANVTASLSNGWGPTFSGSACELSFEYTQCGGLYANPVIPVDCPDPGVLRDGNQYVLTCTSGGAADAYPIYTSTDLVTWTMKGHVFPSGHWPSWAKGDFWAPEIHAVGSQYVVYFSARDTDGQLSIGAASAPSALGPFTDIGHPLVHDPAMGLIDASEITAPGGAHYVLWKEDGNALGKPTPIHAQPLAADGLSLGGSPATLITNDRPWEGPLVEGPFMVEHGGSYYLFYSGNSYASTAYAIGVARASSPLGPFTKAGGPILTDGRRVGRPGALLGRRHGGRRYLRRLSLLEAGRGRRGARATRAHRRRLLAERLARGAAGAVVDEPPRAVKLYGPIPGSNIGRTSDSPSNPGQCFRCSSMNSLAMRTASSLEAAFRMAQPPMTSFASVNGPSFTVISPAWRRRRNPSLLGRSPPVSTRLPSLRDLSTNFPIASISAGGGGVCRYDSEWRMNARYFTGASSCWGVRSRDERASPGSTRPSIFLSSALETADLETRADGDEDACHPRLRPDGLLVAHHGGPVDGGRSRAAARRSSTASPTRKSTCPASPAFSDIARRMRRLLGGELHGDEAPARGARRLGEPDARVSVRGPELEDRRGLQAAGEDVDEAPALGPDGQEQLVEDLRDCVPSSIARRMRGRSASMR